MLRVAVTRKLNSWDVTNYNILKHTGRRVGAVGLGREGWKEGWSCGTGKGRLEGWEEEDLEGKESKSW